MVRTTRNEHASIVIVVAGKQLVQLIKDGVQQLTRGSVPVLQGAIGIDRDYNILSDSLRLGWSPTNHHARHWLLHALIQYQGLLACEHVVDSDFSIVATLSDVLVMWIKSDAHSL